MVDHAVGANWGANIALCNCERGRALRVPPIFALLAVMTLFVLSVPTPQRQRLLAADIRLLEELGAGEVADHIRVGQTLDGFFERLIVSMVLSAI